MAQNTQAAYGRDLRRFFEWNQRSSRTSVHEIGVATVTGYLEYLQGLGLAASSCGRNLVAIRMFFRYLMLEQQLESSSQPQCKCQPLPMCQRKSLQCLGNFHP